MYLSTINTGFNWFEGIMKLSSNDNCLHDRAISLAKQFRATQSELLDVLEEIDRRKVFRILGFGSLWHYCCQGLKLSESDASALIRVTRKSMVVPELKEAVQTGKINLSAAKRVSSVITPENQKEWLKKAEELPQRELEMAISVVEPKSLVKERIKPLREDRFEFKCSISSEAERLVRRVQDLESTKRRMNLDLEKTLIAMARTYLERNDPVEKAKTKLPNLSSAKLQSGSNRVRASIPMPTVHAVNRRDQGSCVWTDLSGKRCERSRFTELHHIQPLSNGGTHAIENLATLCSAHHKAIHDGVRGFKLAV